MFSEQGDYIGGGAARTFQPGNSTFAISGSASDVTVSASGGDRGDSYSLEFAAPRGQQLEPGHVYVGAQRAPFREATRPGIDVTGSGRGCNNQSGSFEVTDLATDASGKVNRLGIVYEQHCEGGKPALFGEVRYGYAPPAGPAAIPTIVRWPSTDVSAPTSVEPVTLLAWNAPVTVTSDSLAGADASHFAVRSDECAGKTITPGNTCQTYLRFAPTAPGTRRAALHLTTAGHPSTEVELDGHAAGGRTQFVMNSEPGDYIGGGRDTTYTPASASIDLSGDRHHASLSVEANNGDWWDADFVAGSGDILAAGRTYTNASRTPFNNGGNGLSVSGSGRGCNTLTGQFTVNEARYTQAGELEQLSLTYEQHCEGKAPALRGTVEYRAGDTTEPAPWMEPLNAQSWTPPPDADAAPGAPAYDQATQPTRVAPAQRSLRSAGTAQRATSLALSSSERSSCGSRLRGARWQRGTAAADRLRSSNAKDVLVLGAGNDRASSGAGADCVAGGTGNDRLDGGAGGDALLGGAGADVLDGGPGADLLVCGPGRDVAYVTPGDRTRGCERIVKR